MRLDKDLMVARRATLRRFGNKNLIPVKVELFVQPCQSPSCGRSVRCNRLGVIGDQSPSGLSAVPCLCLSISERIKAILSCISSRNAGDIVATNAVKTAD